MPKRSGGAYEMRRGQRVPVAGPCLEKAKQKEQQNAAKPAAKVAAADDNKGKK